MKFKDQKEMFAHIWETREHVSEISGKPLHYPGHFKFFWQFGHCLGKQAYPAYKLNPDNIMLMLPEEHEKQETFEVFRQRRDELKEEYHKQKLYVK